MQTITSAAGGSSCGGSLQHAAQAEGLGNFSAAFAHMERRSGKMREDRGATARPAVLGMLLHLTVCTWQCAWEAVRPAKIALEVCREVRRGGGKYLSTATLA